MRRNQPHFNTAQKIGSLLLMLALVWLSVCIPYVYRFQQQVKTEKQSLAANSADSDEDGGLMNNTTEEKAESTPTSSIQEFLHQHLHIEHPSLEQVNEYGHFEQKASIAFHPEYVSPPPEA